LSSTISVILLGIVAWPGPGDPPWHWWAVGAGMATSIIGMALRFWSHRNDRRDIHRVERKAEAD
jgi:protein-S-isoprenylcysteine O-methyltransferase Ste14